ncbi:MAG TPA: hypothetical protein VFC00_01870 [Micromonosporaceae bacterium]|nr:hypothetical protein [Micromonosporaceae bacterium]
MAVLTRSFYDRETARLRNMHAVAIRCARLINTGHIHCVHSPTRAVAVLLDLCAHVRADLAALKQNGC